MDNRELERAGRLGEGEPKVIGTQVYEKLVFDSEIVHFPRKQYPFLLLLADGLSLEEAAAKSNIELSEAQKIIERPMVVKWLESRLLFKTLANEAKNPDRWWAEGFMVTQGARKMDKIQCEVWKERGKRVQPCGGESSGQMKVEISISSDAFKKAKEHRDWVEAQVVQELKHAV